MNPVASVPGESPPEPGRRKTVHKILKEHKMRYLVVGTRGPGFASSEEELAVLENGILPTFDAFLKLEENNKILAGGLPVAERTFVFILEAASNEEADKILRNIPAWGALEWTVTPLQSFAGRAAQEREIVAELKKA